jgi:hypothetical protein
VPVETETVTTYAYVHGEHWPSLKAYCSVILDPSIQTNGKVGHISVGIDFWTYVD